MPSQPTKANTSDAQGLGLEDSDEGVSAKGYHRHKDDDWRKSPLQPSSVGSNRYSLNTSPTKQSAMQGYHELNSNDLDNSDHSGLHCKQ